ncbi:MAG TPA: hypothetical protein VGN17_08695 [Bryobacteraceae bacterium]|jgi:hypothetical protein
MLKLASYGAILTVAAVSLHADSKKSAEDQRIELLRGLTAENATVKTYLPRSKKPLEVDAATGDFNKDGWQAIGREEGPAARTGESIQVTKVTIEKDSIVLELNGGYKGVRTGHWYDKVQVSGPLSGGPVRDGNPSAPAPGGTSISLHFSGGIGDITSAEVKKILAPVLDFEKHSVTEDYLDTVTPETKKAIQEKRAVEGMDRDAVLMALGRPTRKSRDVQDGVEFEDWIYGEPPGRVTFVTFKSQKVIRVKDLYANPGGSVSTPTKQPE